MKTVWFVLLAAFLSIDCSSSVLGQLEKLEDITFFYERNKNEIESRLGYSCRVYAYSSFTHKDPERTRSNKVLEQYVELTEKNGVRRTDIAYATIVAEYLSRYVRNDLVIGPRRLTTTQDGVVEIGAVGARVSQQGGFLRSAFYEADSGWPQALIYSIADSHKKNTLSLLRLKNKEKSQRINSIQRWKMQGKFCTTRM